MKNAIYIGGIFLLSLSFSSCEIEEFLDKPPGVDITEDVIFSSKVELMTLIAGIYYDGVKFGFPYKGQSWNGHFINTGAATDLGDMARDWLPSNDWNKGSVGENIEWSEDPHFKVRWTVIRRINSVLERMDEVPDLTAADKKQIEGEVLFLRALQYFEIFKRYGGAPIVDERMVLTDDLMKPRNTLKETIDFVISDLNAAIALLPLSNFGEMRGRATKGAALALKSRTLLYSASPLFNTGTPYLDNGEHNDLIIYGNEDVNRWQLAADAAKAVLDWAPSGGAELITDQGVEENYKYAWEQVDNKEIILADKPLWAQNAWSRRPWAYITPHTIYSGQEGVSVPMNHIMRYEKRDGTPQDWNMEGGNNLQELYSELEPRFKASIAYNMSYWNDEFPIIEMYEGGRHLGKSKAGTWLRKHIPDALTFRNSQFPNWIMFRLGEFYLNYAEALNEVNGPVPEAYEAINTIRNRSGLPDLPEGLSQDEFRDRVRDERAIELFFEDHRLWDIRRWLAAEDEGPIEGSTLMTGDFYGLKIYPIEGSSEFRYEFNVFERRRWRDRNYLHAWPGREVNKGYLIQNPGYRGNQ